jgi:hypothetical protein
MQVSRHWRLKAQRYRLEGTTCRVCGLPTFPPRPVCSNCAALHPIDVAAPLPTLFSAAPQILTVSSKDFQSVS